MNIKSRHFFISVAAYALGCVAAFAASGPNPRAAVSATSSNVSSARADGRAVSRAGGNATTSGANVSSRTATTNTVSRAASSNIVSRAGAVRTSNTVSRAASNTVSRAGVSRAATVGNVSRAATSGASRTARSGVARAATTARAAARTSAAQSRAARATAVFSDISKIGGGYATCRDAYATCMDQFCAVANDTYRRCYCSSEYEKIRDTESALDQAKSLIQQFENNNLAAVSLSQGEAESMYVATIGEEAIRNDTSKSAALLSEIGDLLSGKKKSNTSGPSNASLGIMNIDFSSSMDDIWSGGGTIDFFGGGANTTDYSTLSGLDLYNDAYRQCAEVTRGSCESSAVLNMAVSAYSIMITNDCNTYQKKVDTQRAAVENVVREAEKQLREARLEDYRSHNSPDVNACLDKVRAELFKETACGPNYRRCLDYSGSYVNPSTGEALYTPQLFKLNDLIILDGTGDILTHNKPFDDFLETRKMFATTALDSCRNIADTVWTEFKRAALIEIAQAQDALIEEVKSTCVTTMTECYDSQSGQLLQSAGEQSRAVGALGVAVARDMCMDKVTACAALYSNGGTNCTFDNNGKPTNPQQCGLASLINFVNAVDDIRIADGCATALSDEVKKFCADTTGVGYPWGCRTMKVGKFEDTNGKPTTSSIAEHLFEFAKLNCVGEMDATSGSYKAGTGVTQFSEFPTRTKQNLQSALDDVAEELDAQLATLCESNDGYWVSYIDYDIYADGENEAKQLRSVYRDKDKATAERVKAYYMAAFNGNQIETVGECIANTVLLQCQAQNSEDATYAVYNASADRCELSEDWYKVHCTQIGGYYEGELCYGTNE